MYQGRGGNKVTTICPVVVWLLKRINLGAFKSEMEEPRNLKFLWFVKFSYGYLVWAIFNFFGLIYCPLRGANKYLCQQQMHGTTRAEQP